MVSKEQLIKCLADAGHRESALNLQNWDVLDPIAESLYKSLSKGRSAESRATTGGQPVVSARVQDTPPILDPKRGGKNVRSQGADPKNPYSQQNAAEHPVGMRTKDRGGSAQYRLRASNKGSTRKFGAGAITERMQSLNEPNPPHSRDDEYN